MTTTPRRVDLETHLPSDEEWREFGDLIDDRSQVLGFVYFCFVDPESGQE